MTGRHRLGLSVVVTVGLGLTGCGVPGQDLAACTKAPDSATNQVAARLRVDGSLRHGFLVPATVRNVVFLSAELHLKKARADKKGDILTFARDPQSDQYLAVDENARKDSTWPPATFDVRKKAAITSRACTDKERGKP